MKLFQHQLEGIRQGKAGNLCLFWQPGTGKSRTILELIRYWRAQGRGPALILAPKSILQSVWIEEAQKWTPELKATCLWHRNRTERLRLLQRPADVYIINYESARTIFDEIAQHGFDILICDESSRLKDWRTLTSKAILALSGFKLRGSQYKTKRPIPHRYFATGTPSPNSRLEFWCQIVSCTGPGNRIFNDNPWIFRSRWFDSVNLGNTGQRLWKFRNYLQEEFLNRMSSVTHIVNKKDALPDLPSMTHQVRSVELSKKERAVYDQFKKDLVIRFGNQMILGNSALKEISKLRQLCSGFAYSEDSTPIEIGNSKRRELKNLLWELGDSQVIVWCQYIYEIEKLLEEIPDSIGLWGGCKDREQAINDFQNGCVRVLIAHPQAAGHGLNLENASYNLYISHSFSYEQFEQSMNRIHRPGQKNVCVCYHLLAEKTIDQYIYQVLQHKGDMSAAILNYLKDGKLNATEQQKIAV